MKLLYSILLALPLLAVDGQVLNQTTGKPQPGATVTLFKLGGQAGPQVVESVKSGTDGKFVIDKPLAPGPSMIQTAFDGVTYNLMLPPGRPTSGLQVEVFNTSPKPGAARAANHMLLLEPQNGKLAVRESYFFLNEGKTTWNDEKNGTLRFQLPAKPEGPIQINCTAPQGVPIRRAATEAGPPNTWKLDFPIKPGETRIDLAYTLSDASSYKTRLLTKADQAMIAAPNGVTVTGAGLVDKGKEPRTQASIFELSTQDLDLKLEGQGELSSGRGGGGEDAESRGPSISQVNPRVHDRLYWILGLTFGILAIGFVLLYRTPEPKR
ncbi:MAG: hypothetical protein NTX13_09965 [Acidobacteria bacterium]|nr:hypothetical protein [Acidobacteriota bacterium]